MKSRGPQGAARSARNVGDVVAFRALTERPFARPSFTTSTAVSFDSKPRGVRTWISHGSPPGTITVQAAFSARGAEESTRIAAAVLVTATGSARGCVRRSSVVSRRLGRRRGAEQEPVQAASESAASVAPPARAWVRSSARLLAVSRDSTGERSGSGSGATGGRTRSPRAGRVSSERREPGPGPASMSQASAAEPEGGWFPDSGGRLRLVHGVGRVSGVDDFASIDLSRNVAPTITAITTMAAIARRRPAPPSRRGGASATAAA